MRYRFHTADVFTDHPFGGNPLAVVHDARGLSDRHMQQVAREFNLSETVFVVPPDDPAHTCRLRIFTPAAELPFAGHPTVGTAIVLAATGGVPLTGDETEVVFEEGAGPVPVSIRTEHGRPVFAQLSAPMMPEFGPETPSRDAVAEVLSLSVDDLEPALNPRPVSCGVPTLFVAVRDRRALGQVRIDPAAWARTLKNYWAPHVYAFCLDPETPGAHVRARMFAPALGIAEDPATGAAATALAGYMVGRWASGDGELRWVIEQGMEMGRPSLIHVEAQRRDGALAAIRVGGAAVLISSGEIDVPDD